MCARVCVCMRQVAQTMHSRDHWTIKCLPGELLKNMHTHILRAHKHKYTSADIFFSFTLPLLSLAFSLKTHSKSFHTLYASFTPRSALALVEFPGLTHLFWFLSFSVVYLFLFIQAPSRCFSLPPLLLLSLCLPHLYPPTFSCLSSFHCWTIQWLSGYISCYNYGYPLGGDRKYAQRTLNQIHNIFWLSDMRLSITKSSFIPLLLSYFSCLLLISSRNKWCSKAVQHKQGFKPIINLSSHRHMVQAVRYVCLTIHCKHRFSAENFFHFIVCKWLKFYANRCEFTCFRFTCLYFSTLMLADLNELPDCTQIYVKILCN